MLCWRRDDDELQVSSVRSTFEAWSAALIEYLSITIGWTRVKNGVSLEVYADIYRKLHSGLIVISPINWIIYYISGKAFYYLTNSVSLTASGGGFFCRDGETCSILLRPSVRVPSSSSSLSSTTSGERMPQQKCISGSITDILGRYARRSSRCRVNLTPFFIVDDRRFTVIDALNKLIDLDVL